MMIMRYAAALVTLLWAAAPAFAADPSNLIATGRTDTQLYLQWDANGNTSFTVDYLGPEYFGGAQPTCSDFPQHSNIFETSDDTVIISGLQPSTWYHIHVHALDPGVGGSTNVIIVKTLAAGSGFESISTGSPDYIICGGGDGGGDEECAQVTFMLLPGSLPFTEVQLTVLDRASGEMATFPVPIGEPQSISPGSYHLLFTAPDGYMVTSVQRGLNVSCGDDLTVKLRFRTEPPGRKR